MQPLTDSQHDYAQSDDEQRLIQRANADDEELARKGLVFKDDEIDNYVQRVAARLVPVVAARAVSFRFRVIRDPTVNAFALPNGSIYITVGLMARFETETQLAHVLSHEIVHVVQRHAVAQLRNRKATMITAHVADLVLLGTSIAYLPALGSLASYSQGAESEADRMALDYLSRAGYPLAGTERTFQIIQEVKSRDSVAGSVWASHPGNAARIQATREAIAEGKLELNPQAPDGAKEYEAVRKRLIITTLQVKLNVRQYELTVASAEQAIVRNANDPWSHYYRGEAYRLMADDPTGAAREHAWIHETRYNTELVESYRKRKSSLLDEAAASYRQILTIDRNFAVAHRGLGLVAYARGEGAAAREALNRYLLLGRGIDDRRYIQDIIGRIEKP